MFFSTIPEGSQRSAVLGPRVLLVKKGGEVTLNTETYRKLWKKSDGMSGLYSKVRC